MDEVKTIDVCIPTWPNHPKRIEYLRTMLDACDKFLTASRHELLFYCSSENERDPLYPTDVDTVVRLCEKHRVLLRWRHNKRANLGGNMNDAMKLGTGEFIFLQQDDWCLTEPLDLSDAADLLDEHRDLDLVRFNWPTDPRMLPTFEGDVNGWPKIDVTGRWPYGDDPHLRRRDFMDKWRWYYDKGAHGTASADLMQALVRGNAHIVVSDKPYFQHVGYVSAVVDDVRSGAGRRAEMA